MRGLVASLVLLGSLVAGEARASWPPQTVAQVFFQSGSARFAAGEYAQALAEFQAAYAAYPAPALLVNIGQALRQLERVDEAAIAYKNFLDLRTGDSALRAEVWEALDEVLNEVETRMGKLAAEVIMLRKVASTLDADPMLKAEALRKAHELTDHMLRVDATLTLGFGRVHLLALPSLSPPSDQVAAK